MIDPQWGYMNTTENKSSFNWQDFAARSSILSACLALLAISIGSPLYLGSKIDNFRREFQQDMNEFRKDMRDFHGRLCALEERSKN